MSEATFRLLAPGVQRAIWEMGWKELRPIQTEAIQSVLGGEKHLLITASTAGGKTEAAFLPILSRLASGPNDSVHTIYIGPLKALINDQFARLDRLCERLEIPVHRWHGDVSATHKQKLRRDPSGILLITPESLESNFINYGNQIPRLYRDLEFVVIDELHSFLGNVRGVHLLSLLSRLRTATSRNPRMIGLSATLGDPEMGKQFLSPDSAHTVVHLSDAGTRHDVRFVLKAVLRAPDPKRAGNVLPRLTCTEAREFVAGKTKSALLASGESIQVETQGVKRENEPPPSDELDDIADDLLRHFGHSSNLVFVNSRRTAEELALRVHDRVTREKWPRDPFAVHHGSIAKDLREETEAALKSGVPTTAICSSTLEMGIDLGSVRAVGQIDPPWTVSSLVQRLGRSGRRDGESAIMRLYVREESPHSGSRLSDLLYPDLLRGIALTRLMLVKWLEPGESSRTHLSTLVHQILSFLKQTGGMVAVQLHKSLVIEGPFRAVSPVEFGLLLRELAAKKVIEQLPTGELILAPVGERITSAYDFYAAFKGSELFTVRHQQTEIGELPLEALPPPGHLVVLAGRRWLVDRVDAGKKSVEVSPAKSGAAPLFLGRGGELHGRVVTEMKAVLFGQDHPEYLDEPARELLRAARTVAHTVGLPHQEVIATPDGLRWFPWVGTRCLRTLAILAEIHGVACDTDRLSLSLALSDEDDFRSFWKQVLANPPSPSVLGEKVTPRMIEKFDEFLPEALLIRSCASDRLALPEALAALDALSKNPVFQAQTPV